MSDKLANRLLWVLAVAGGAALYYARRSARYEVACECATERLEEADQELKDAENLIDALTNELSVSGGEGSGVHIRVIAPSCPVTALQDDDRDDGGDVDQFMAAMNEGDGER